jgi:hypothetical protein
MPTAAHPGGLLIIPPKRLQFSAASELCCFCFRNSFYTSSLVLTYPSNSKLFQSFSHCSSCIALPKSQWRIRSRKLTLINIRQRTLRTCQTTSRRRWRNSRQYVKSEDTITHNQKTVHDMPVTMMKPCCKLFRYIIRSK